MRSVRGPAIVSKLVQVHHVQGNTALAHEVCGGRAGRATGSPHGSLQSPAASENQTPWSSAFAWAFTGSHSKPPCGLNVTTNVVTNQGRAGRDSCALRGHTGPPVCRQLVARRLSSQKVPSKSAT
jgi:hypothetical protein